MRAAGVSDPVRDAKRLTVHALGLDDLALAVRENEAVDVSQAAALDALVSRRLAGEPLGRILGHRSFFGLDFTLNPATLEPRPETELLVEQTIALLPSGGRFLDLGTGTGCIPIATLCHCPDAQAVATDLSSQALESAHANARMHGVAERLQLHQGSWFAALPFGTAPFDVIVSNPPYIAAGVIPSLHAEVREHDPLLALDGGPDGLAPYRIIAAEGRTWLKPSGVLLLEIGFDQATAVAALLARAGWGDIAVRQDFAGLDRVVLAHHLSQ